MKIKRYLFVKAGEVLLVIATLLLCLSFKVHAQNHSSVSSINKIELIEDKESLESNVSDTDFDEEETFPTFEGN